MTEKLTEDDLMALVHMASEEAEWRRERVSVAQSYIPRHLLTPHQYAGVIKEITDKVGWHPMHALHLKLIRMLEKTEG
jgi:hypothetical protein